MNDLISRKALIEKICSTQINKTEGELLEMPPSYWQGVNDKQISILDVIAALEAQQVDRWVPCVERLPDLEEKETYKNVNATIKYQSGTHKTVPLTWERKGKDKKPTWCYLGRVSDWDVIAWRPLPEYYDPLAEKIQKILDREHDRISGKK